MFYEDNYMAARNYLGLVREAQETIDVLEKRISLRGEIGVDNSELEGELANARDVLKVRKADTAETISRLKGTRVQLVMMKRYVDLETWEKIAEDLDMGIRSVQSIHGGGLVQLEERLAEGGTNEVHTPCVSAVRD